MQIEDAKAMNAKLQDDIRKLQEEKDVILDKMEDLAGKPEKLKKQVQI